MSGTVPIARPESLTRWLRASPAERERGLERCLKRIRALDPSIHAWVQVAPQKPSGKGKLSQIPFGAKDVMETQGLATEYGSALYQGRVGTEDAAMVRDLRGHGAILLGKLACAAFAYFTPGPTRNPRNLEHTPGGSSSGSAAAVAAGMVPIALGTQTMGSVLRPASYCGVTGFKPSFGLFSVEGVLPLAQSLDTIGFFTNAPEDMLSLWEAMGQPAGETEDVPLAAPEHLPEVEPAMGRAFNDALSRLRQAGAQIRSLDIAGMLADLHAAAKTVMFYEGARFHQERYKQHGERLGKELAQLVQEGLQISREKYDRARSFIAESKAWTAETFKSTPVILTPAATGPAPHGLASTGDPRMNSPWTALGTPAISIPLPVAEGLPLGLQLTADQGQDAQLLRAAVRLRLRLNGKKAVQRPLLTL